MSKGRLVDEIESGFVSRAAAERAVDTVIDGIERVLKAGDDVSLRGFGTFAVRARAAQPGRNPRTGEAITIPASRKLYFRSKAKF